MTQATRLGSNFPSGLEIGGVPLALTPGGKVFYVHDNDTTSPHASDGNAGTTADKPLATIDAAINKCTAGRGDTILVLPGHAETITSAAGIAMDTANVRLLGLGSGNNRPQITFSTAVAASLDVTAAGCEIRNIITICAVDSQTAVVNLQAAGCTLDFEHRDTSASVEADLVVLGNASADNCDIKLKVRGFSTGDEMESAIKLVGSSDTDIDIDFHGTASTAVVDFATTACTNIKVRGRSRNASANVTKIVTDSQGSSTYDVLVHDDGYGDTIKITDTLSAHPISRRTVESTSVALTGGDVADAFTVNNGAVLVKMIVLEITTAVSANAALIHFEADPTRGTSNTPISKAACAADIASAAVGDQFAITGDSAVVAVKYANGTALADSATSSLGIVVPEGGIDLKLSTSNPTTGIGTLHIMYEPLTPDAYVS